MGHAPTYSLYVICDNALATADSTYSLLRAINSYSASQEISYYHRT